MPQVDRRRVVVDHRDAEALLTSSLIKLKGSTVNRQYYQQRPVEFCQKVLGHKTWSKQEEILRSAFTNRKTAVKACHASSKTFSAAEAVLAWITAFSDGIAITTAPTWVQVKNLLWGEIHRAISTAKYPYPEPNQTEIRLAPGNQNFAIGFSTDVGDRFQGWHGHILLVFDEASGVRPALWEAAEGIRAGSTVHMLVIGNPTTPGGPFYDCFHGLQDVWNGITISAFDTPNLAGVKLQDLVSRRSDDPWLDEDPIPYLTTRRWVYERYHEWGPDSPMWESRVLGDFPSQSLAALYPIAWLEAAKYRDISEEPTARPRAGIDVAGPGEDETVVTIMRGPDVLVQKAFTDDDPRAKVARVLQMFEPDDYETVNVDTVGIGYYFALDLQDQGFNVRKVNMQEEPYDSEAFSDFRSEVMWALRERLQGGNLNGLLDDTTRAQASTVQYEQAGRNRIKVESKKDAAKRGVKSPDRLESLVLATLEPEDYVAPSLGRAFGGPRLFIVGNRDVVNGARQFSR